MLFANYFQYITFVPTKRNNFEAKLQNNFYKHKIFYNNQSIIECAVLVEGVLRR